MIIRRGREFYGKRYEEAVRLFNEGKEIGEIAKQLGISYSTAYHWAKGLRKPEIGNVNEFMEFLRSRGPSSALQTGRKFPKHNELFLMASRRGLDVKRAYLGRKYKELATWYYLQGQENELDSRTKELLRKIDEMRDRLKRAAYK